MRGVEEGHDSLMFIYHSLICASLFKNLVKVICSYYEFLMQTFFGYKFLNIELFFCLALESND